MRKDMLRNSLSDTQWESALMLGAWERLIPAEQALAVKVAQREGVEVARQAFVPAGARSVLEQPVGLSDFQARFVAPADAGRRYLWNQQTANQQRRDPRVYHFVSAMERERRRLAGDSALPDDPVLLQRSANVSRNLATEICTVATADAELAEMIALAAGDGEALGLLPGQVS